MCKIRRAHLLLMIMICLVGSGCASMPVSHPNQGRGAVIAAPPLAGCVQDHQGNPLVDVFLATKVLTPGVPLPTVAVTTNEAGCYTHASLYPGTYEISITVEGYQSTTQRVDIIDGKVTTLDFVLQPAR